MLPTVDAICLMDLEFFGGNRLECGDELHFWR